jgi:DNA invertase Pin-like site-specific DNA recombinase
VDVTAYIRVSTSDQADSGLGLAAQEAIIRSACEQRGWSLAAVERDAGRGAGSMRGREGLTAALARVEQAPGRALMVAKLDRLSRSMIDFAALMERSRRRGWALVALDLGVDTTTPAGEVMANVMAAFAQYERRLIGQRTREALAVKRDQGVRLGRPRVMSDAARDRCRVLRAQGLPLAKIADQLTAEAVPTAHGGRRWYGSTVRAALA